MPNAYNISRAHRSHSYYTHWFQCRVPSNLRILHFSTWNATKVASENAEYVLLNQKLLFYIVDCTSKQNVRLKMNFNSMVWFGKLLTFHLRGQLLFNGLEPNYIWLSFFLADSLLLLHLIRESRSIKRMHCIYHWYCE